MLCKKILDQKQQVAKCFMTDYITNDTHMLVPMYAPRIIHSVY